MKTTIISIFILSFLVIGCQSDNKNLHKSNIETINIEKPISLSIEELIEDFDTIRLEASDHSLLSNIRHIRIMNDKLYVTDKTESSVFIFTMDGKYISKISDQGQGPKEYLRISRLEVDPFNSRVLITDAFSRKLLIYDEAGRQSEVIQVDFFPMRFVSDKSQRRMHLNSGSIMLDLSRNEISNDHNILIIDGEGNIENSFLEDKTPQRINITNGASTSYTDNGELLYMPILSNIIYRIHENEALPEFELVPRDHSVLTDEDKKEIFYTFEKENVTEYEDNGHFLSFGCFLKSDNIILLSSGWNKSLRTFYSTKSKKAFTYEPKKMKGNEYMQDIFYNFPQAATGETFYIGIDPVSMEYATPQLPEGKLKTFFESFTEDDNPCIIAYRINKKLFDVEK